MARLIAPRLSERLGQQVVVDNRAGATGNIGAELAARSVPDGYTVLMAGASIAINVSLYAKRPFELTKDLAPVTLVANSPNIVLVHPSLPAKSIRELIALAHSRPGQLNYASGGSGRRSVSLRSSQNHDARRHRAHSLQEHRACDPRGDQRRSEHGHATPRPA